MVKTRRSVSRGKESDKAEREERPGRGPQGKYSYRVSKDYTVLAPIE